MHSDIPEAGEGASGEMPPSGSASLESVLDRYLQALADGEDPDQEEFLRQYPQLANSLRGVFKTLDFVEATSKSLSTSRLTRGTILGEYRILREIGRGGMGVVYEAVQTSLNRRVALKVLPTGAMLSETAPERFLREATMAGRLHHSNIVPVYAVGQEQGVHFYAMQFIEGRSLAEFLRDIRRGAAPCDRDYFHRVARWAQQIADALEYAHGQGTIHRDIKPSNLLLDRRDCVWVTDFGLARADSLVSITLSGDVVGTARYMSPEQARGGYERVDHRADIYSLGATLYELLGLQPAFDGQSREIVLNRIVFSNPTPLAQLNRSIPRDLQTIVAKCMEKDPAARYASAADVGEDCRRFLHGEPIRARRPSVLVKTARLARRHRVHVVGAGLAMVLALIAVLMVFKVRHVQGEHALDEAYRAILYERNAPRATSLVDEASALGVDSAKLHLCRGLIPLFGSEPQRAIPALLEAWRRDPQDVEICYALAYAYQETTDPATAQRFFDHTKGRAIDSALGWLLRGLAQTHMDRNDVIDSYNRAISVNPDFIPALEARATFRGFRLLVEGRRADLEPMLSDFDAWVVFRPASDRSYSSRAMGWLHAAAFAATQSDLRPSVNTWLENCRKDLDHASTLRQPDTALMLARRGLYCRYIGDYRAAAESYAAAMTVDRESTGENHPGLVHHHAISLHACGDIDAALAEITPACADLPSFYPVTLHRAILLAEAGRPADARTACLEALEHQRGSLMGLLMGAAVMELLGDFPGAREAVTQAAALNARQPELAEANPSCRLMLAYLLGELDGGQLLNATANQPGTRCEVSLVIALCELGRGHRQAGVAALDECLGTGVFIYIEHRFAQALRARAAADPNWPEWVEEVTE